MPSPTSEPAATQSASYSTPYQPQPRPRYLHCQPQPAASTAISRNDSEIRNLTRKRSRNRNRNLSQPSHLCARLPLPFQLPLRSNPSSSSAAAAASSSSSSLAPSVARGRPIPVDDTTAESRTEALRELNSHYPSRHRFAKSAGAENTTYSEPVIVRTYYRLPPPGSRYGGYNMSPGRSNGSSNSKSNSSDSYANGVAVIFPRGRNRNRHRNRHSTTSGFLHDSVTLRGGTTSLGSSSSLPAKMASASSSMLSIMARARGAARRPAVPSLPEDATLPPLDAFTFKSFLQNSHLQDPTTSGDASAGHDINADLDRIAEICARSRYSLSNQYEVHHVHAATATAAGSSSKQQPRDAHGPTLQAVTSDDESHARTTTTTTERKRRRLDGRRNSRAVGTLETIMSSSRSSDDDVSYKKQPPAGAETNASEHKTSSAAVSTLDTDGCHRHRHRDQAQIVSQDAPATCTHAKQRRTLSSSLALIDSAIRSAAAPQQSTANTAAEPVASSSQPVSSAVAAALVGEPARPQPCTSQLQVHTALVASDVSCRPVVSQVEARRKSDEQGSGGSGSGSNPCSSSPVVVKGGGVSSVSVSVDNATASGSFLMEALAGWMPWGGGCQGGGGGGGGVGGGQSVGAGSWRGRAVSRLRGLLRDAADHGAARSAVRG